MSNFLLTKDFIGEPLDVSTNTRQVKIAIAAFGNIDRGKEILHPGAATRTIKERGPQGTNEIWHLGDHDYTLAKALSKFSELYTTPDHIVGVSTIAKTTFGNDVLEHYKNKAINQHSIGYAEIQAPIDSKTGVKNIKEIALWEGSSVLWGMNPNTPTFGKSLTGAQVIDKLDTLLKCWTNGKYSDEFFSLIKMQILSIKQYVSDLELKASNYTGKKPNDTDDTTEETENTSVDEDSEEDQAENAAVAKALKQILQKHKSL